MGNIAQFDVLVVYSAKIATSASAADSIAPFLEESKHAEYNYPYAYFLEECARQNLQAAFTTSADITAPGQCDSYWLYENKQWIKHEGSCSAPLIFDKFSPVNKTQQMKRELFFSSPQLQSFNDEYLFSLFFDKHQMYKKLAGFSVPTVAITHGSKRSIASSLKKLERLVATHPHSADFGTGVVIKDRFGAGGIHVYKVAENCAEGVAAILKRNTGTSFVAQPFAQFDRGFRYQNVVRSTDIRLIYQERAIVQTYIRMAKAGDFRCNEHQGGTLTYVPVRAIPSKVIRFANHIADLLTKKHALFALDFIISNNGNVYLLEGNTGPGLDWNSKLKKNEMMAKKLIRIIVKNLSERTGAPEELPLPPFVYTPATFMTPDDTIPTHPTQRVRLNER